MSDLDRFSPATARWFADSFEKPTPAQAGAWEAIATGRDCLVVAPTGSGKTLAAFLWSIDRLMSSPPPADKERLRVLYVSPLKALAVDVDRNLRSPLTGIGNAATRLGSHVPDIRVAIRTGDTPADERRRFASKPPDILITTPESLFLLLTSRAREALAHIDTVIVDEVHSIAGSKRGAHLAVSLERLDQLLPRPAVRIGLSATVRPLDEVARFLGGSRDVTIVNPVSEKEFDLSVVVPVEDMTSVGEPLEEFPVGHSAAGEPQRKTIWTEIEARILDLIRQHRSTIVFANSRGLSERLSARLNELAGETISRSHHGSVSKEQRRSIEEELKAGRLPAVVATSSLELGIDMGSVDLVIQVEAPTSVASGLQRVGRAGHQVGAVSRGVIFPKWRGDLVECAVVVERMKQGKIEAISYPRNPLDVLAQQIVAMVAMDEWNVGELAGLIRRSAPFAALPDSALDSVLNMLSGLYPSDGFAELRPRINWDRLSGTITPRPQAQKLAVTSGGTIPDRGLFGVFLYGTDGARVGELDEEMVYESRVGEVFRLGSSTWRIEEITHDRVLVSPAPGEVGKLPFWHGDAIGRPLELGRAHGEFLREISNASTDTAMARLAAAGLDELASKNLLMYLGEQKVATGRIPDDRTIVVERFRDELGDWRVCIHTPFGAQVHAPWAIAIQARVADRLGIEVQTMHSDDGIVVRLPEADEAPPASSVIFEDEEIEQLVTEATGGSALFASRFRECAARALLLPKRQPGKRTPLWQQRQKSHNLLQVSAGYGSFPIILETMRECLQDVFDLPGLKELMNDIATRRVKVIEVDTEQASPFASSLLFGYVGAFIYEGDAPLAERRAQALSLDTALLAELLGQSELRELIDADSLADLELDLQKLSSSRRIRDIDDAHDALRQLGDLTTQELVDRGCEPEWPAELASARRALALTVAGEARWVAAEDAGRFRDALGTPLPVGVPEAFLDAGEDPLGDLVSRYARTHGPFEPGEVCIRLGLAPAVVETTLRRLESSGRVMRGDFRPGGTALEWCDAEVLRMLRRRSLAKLRNQVEAAPKEILSRFIPAWQGVGESGAYGHHALMRAIEQMQGYFVPAAALETLVLPARVQAYSPSMLDELCASGEVVWAGNGAIGMDDGWVSLYLADDAPLLLPNAKEVEDPLAQSVLGALSSSGAQFFRQLADNIEAPDDTALLDALFDLVWAGRITNDTLGPLRAGRRSRKASSWGRSTSRRAMRRPTMPTRQGPAAAQGRWTLLPQRVEDATRRAHALAEQLLDRYGILTRGAVMGEGTIGGFAGIYPVLKTYEEMGRCRRGYFVEGLGAAQFAVPGAVDRMRAMVDETRVKAAATLLAATDPANPYGACLPWPDRPVEGPTAHRPARKAGAVVVMVQGAPVMYVEKGGRTLLTWTEDPEILQPAVDALAQTARAGNLGKLSVQKADGEPVADSVLAQLLLAAGFRRTYKGLYLRA